jgi:Uncharacterized protein conserved in bacteria (DUF2252)
MKSIATGRNSCSCPAVTRAIRCSCSSRRRRPRCYLGAGGSFDRALASFAEAYADQNERDYRALREAVQSGRVEAETGI